MQELCTNNEPIMNEIASQNGLISSLIEREAAIRKRAMKISKRNSGAGKSALRRASYLKILISIIKPYLDNLTTEEEDVVILNKNAKMLTPNVLVQKINYALNLFYDASNDGHVTEKVIQLAKCKVEWNEEIPTNKQGKLDGRFKPVRFTATTMVVKSEAPPKAEAMATSTRTPQVPYNWVDAMQRRSKKLESSRTRRAKARLNDEKLHLKKVTKEKGCHIRKRNSEIMGTRRGKCELCESILEGNVKHSNRVKRSLSHAPPQRRTRFYRKKQQPRIESDVCKNDLSSNPGDWDKSEKQWLSNNIKINQEAAAELLKKGEQHLSEIISKNMTQKVREKSNVDYLVLEAE